MAPRSIVFFLFFQSMHAALLYSISGVFQHDTLLVISGSVTSILYLYLGFKEFTTGKTALSPLLFYFISSFVRLGLLSIYCGMVLSSGFGMYLGPVSITQSVLMGYIILLTGDLFFIFGYYLVKRSNFKVLDESLLRFETSFVAGLVLLLVSSIIVFSSYAGLPLEKLGQLTNMFKDYGVPAALYFLLRQVTFEGTKRHTKILCYLLIAGNFYVSLFSYMKADVFLALFPLLLVWAEGFWLRLKAKENISYVTEVGKLALLSWCFISVISVYSTIRRAEFQYDFGALAQSEFSVETVPYLIQAASAAVPGTPAFAQFHEFPTSGAWGIASRLNAASVAAWSYQQVSDFGNWNRSFFQDLVTAVTPRVFWPNKPQIWPARLLSVELGMAASAEDASSSTGLTMAGAYYWWGGIFGLVFGMLFSGAMLSVTWSYVAQRWRYNPVATMVAVALFFQCLQWYEGAFFGNLPFYVYVVVVYLPLMIVVGNFLQSKRILISKS